MINALNVILIEIILKNLNRTFAADVRVTEMLRGVLFKDG